jgi:hypothetical protein
MVTCYLTPSLEATIISPDAIGHEFQCHGYTSVSNFDGVGCSLTLHHCHYASLDACFPLLLVQGASASTNDQCQENWSYASFAAASPMSSPDDPPSFQGFQFSFRRQDSCQCMPNVPQYQRRHARRDERLTGGCGCGYR